MHILCKVMFLDTFLDVSGKPLVDLSQCCFTFGTLTRCQCLMLNHLICDDRFDKIKF